MKLARYGAPGQERPALIDDEGQLRDLAKVVQDIHPRMLDDESINYVRGLDPGSLPLVEGEPRLGPCVCGVGKFIGVGLNYADHAAESGQDVPSEPILFSKAISSISGPDDPIELPRGSVKTDWEVELGVIMAYGAKNISQADALKYIAGYCTINDVSERAWQVEGTGQWLKGKSHDTFGPIGPWLVTRDEVGDPQNPAMWLEVNGQRRQDGNTSTMVFGVAELVSYISRFMTLKAGDIIATGTPPGVGMGMKPPTYLRVGDRVTLEVVGLGVQSHLVTASA
ncbi:MAG: fumarylacetoacetate hydrolase family protein [Gammaproteobacteria bacterium]|nr:fumarylacetoacetate hydrolase family protein [Gammaproteobacteria bacterium]